VKKQSFGKQMFFLNSDIDEKKFSAKSAHFLKGKNFGFAFPEIIGYIYI